MKIGIDARLYNQTGVGRYIRNLIIELGKLDQTNYYIVFLRKKDEPDFQLPNPRWQKKVADVNWHGFSEQLLMPYLLYREKFDLVHFPYFNVPILYFKPFIVTIHDLTHLHFNTGKASTKPFYFYQLKRLGLKIALWWSTKFSKRIIAVSETTKNEIISHFKINPNKIFVSYEGVETMTSCFNDNSKKPEMNLSDNFLLYVGNAYPHKNLDFLIKAFEQIIKTPFLSDLKIYLVGPDDFFYQRLKSYVNQNQLNKQVIFYGQGKDNDLVYLFQRAECLVLPSLMEGFGLVGLEAMSLNCPVIASDIPAFKEVYQEAAVYFSPHNINDLSDKIQELLTDKIKKEELIKKGKIRVKLFSWKKMAEETLNIYKQTVK